MNIWQSICLGLGIVALTGLWVHQAVFSGSFDVIYLIVVSIMIVAITAGFVFACKNIGNK